MTRALVTGGTGFLGCHVVRRLLRESLEVRCLVRNLSRTANLAELPVDYVQGDLTDAASLVRALKGCDQLYHVAADYRLWVGDPAEMHRANVEGTRVLLEAAAQAGVTRIVLTSSVSAVGRPVSPSGEWGVGNESLDPPQDQLIGPYKRTKFEAEKVAREFAARGVPVVIVNPSTPIGSHDIKPTPTGKMIVDFLNGRMPGFVDTGLNFVDVEDVAEGHWLAGVKGNVGERYILGRANLTLEEFLGKVARASGRPAPNWKIPYAVAWLAGAASTTWARLTGSEPSIPLDGVRMARHPMFYDASKAVRELGLPQTPLEQSIEKAVRWFRDHRYVQ